MLTNPMALMTCIVAMTALGFWLEGRFEWARRVGASMLVILFGAMLSNLEWVPLKSPVYDAIGGPVTSLAIVWLLLAVDFRQLRAAGPRMAQAFALAVVGTCLGALTAALTVGRALGDVNRQLAGVMTGTYAGGSVNFVAVGRAVGLEETYFTAATAADNVLTAVWVAATLMLPLWLKRFYPERPGHAGAPAAAAQSTKASSTTASATTTSAAQNPFLADILLRPFDLLALLTLGLGTILVADGVAAQVPAIPSVLWLSTFALLLGQLPAVRRLSGALQLGLVALNLFFVIIGIGSRVSEIFRVGPQVFYFTVLVVTIHGLVVYLGGRLLRLDVETLSVASQAAVGGPSTALALTAARGWQDLALPGLVVGLLGYAVGNYAGFAMAALVGSW